MFFAVVPLYYTDDSISRYNVASMCRNILPILYSSLCNLPLSQISCTCYNTEKVIGRGKSIMPYSDAQNEPLQNTTQRRMTVLKSRWQKAKRLRSRPTPSPKGKASMVLSTESLTKPCRPRDSKAIKLPRHLRRVPQMPGQL